MRIFFIILCVTIHAVSHGQPIAYQQRPTANTSCFAVWNIAVPPANASFTFADLNTTSANNGVNGMDITTTALSGKQVFAVVYTGTHLESVGIGTSTFNSASYCGGSNQSYGLINGLNGFYFNTSVQTMANQPNYGAGDTLYVAFDATALLLWYKKGYNGTWSGTSGNPATGTGGFTVASGTWYPGAGDQQGNTRTILSCTSIPDAALPAGFIKYTA